MIYFREFNALSRFVNRISCASSAYIVHACPVRVHVYALSIHSGLAVVGLSTVASFGFMGIMSYDLAPANFHMVIYLSLALGMHSVYQFIHHLNNHSREIDVDERMKVRGCDIAWGLWRCSSV